MHLDILESMEHSASSGAPRAAEPLVRQRSIGESPLLGRGAMVRSAASSISLARHTERVVARLRHLLEERRRLLEERRLQLKRWQALLATSRVVLSEAMPAPVWLVQPLRFAIQLPASEQNGDPLAINGIRLPNDPRPTIGGMMAKRRSPALLRRASGLR